MACILGILRQISYAFRGSGLYLKPDGTRETFFPFVTVAMGTPNPTMFPSVSPSYSPSLTPSTSRNNTFNSFYFRITHFQVPQRSQRSVLVVRNLKDLLITPRRHAYQPRRRPSLLVTRHRVNLTYLAWKKKKTIFVKSIYLFHGISQFFCTA